MSRSVLSDFLDPLTEPEFARRLFPFSYLNALDRKQVLQAAQARLVDPLVVKELRSQNQPLSVEQENSLKLLSLPNTVCVITGQQLGLFGGPAFTLYKALSAIKLAQELSRELGCSVVPIFWLQSEDHDFNEIQRCNFYGLEDQIKSVSFRPMRGVGDSVGKIQFSQAELQRIKSELESSLPPSMIGGHAWEILWQAYTPDRTIASSFSALVSRLLGKYGLLCFDCATPAIKERYKDLFASAEIGRASIEEGLKQRSNQLISWGYQPQVGIKEGTTLFFVSIAGNRVRLNAGADGDFYFEKQAIKKDELYELLNKSPQSFTCGALLRPILQDKIFPTLAYVAGPSEFAYWAELEPLYRYFKLPFPLVVPRAHFNILDHKHVERMTKLELDNTLLSGKYRDFLNTRVSQQPILDDLKQIIERFKSGITELNIPKDIPWLSQSRKKTIFSVSRSTERFRYKLERALVDRDRNLERLFERSKRYYLPLGLDQERVVSWIGLLLRHGPSLIDKVFEQIEPFSSARQDLNLGN